MRYILLFLISLPAFALDIPDRAEDSVTFSWSAPSERMDGSLLPPDQIGGYELYYSADGGETQVVEIGVTTSHSLERLDPGSYEAAISTVDTDGLYSEPSNTVTFEIGSRPKPPSLLEVIKQFLSSLFDRISEVFT